MRAKGGPAIVATGIHANIAQGVQELIKLGVVFHRLRGKFQKAFADQIAKGCVVHFCAGRADDPCLARQLTHHKTVKQARDDLAAREIAGRAENDEIKLGNGNDARNHEINWPSAGGWCDAAIRPCVGPYRSSDWKSPIHCHTS